MIEDSDSDEVSMTTFTAKSRNSNNAASRQSGKARKGVTYSESSDEEFSMPRRKKRR